MGFFHRHRGLTPYLLLLPGLAWLAIFFLVPLGLPRLPVAPVRDVRRRLRVRLGLGQLLGRAPAATTRGSSARSIYAGLATVIALLISYPLAYWIAFRGGRWKNVLLVMIIAPFFVTYLIRTLAWETILADQGPVVGRPARRRHPRRQRPAARNVDRRRRGHHLQLPALHGAAALRGARVDRRPADRGRRGSVREQGPGVPPRDAAALDAGRRRRARSSPSSRPPATSSTPSCSARRSRR